MDIVNWLYLKNAELIRTQINKPADLILLGADVGFDNRGDKYLTYSMPFSAFATSIAEEISNQFSVTLKTNGVNNTVQNVLNLVNGNNITIVDNGNGSVAINGSPGIALRTNGTNNPTQNVLNLVEGSNINITSGPSGVVTIEATTSTAQGLQDVISEDNVLTQNNTIDCNNTRLTFDDVTNFSVFSNGKLTIENVSGVNGTEFSSDDLNAAVKYIDSANNYSAEIIATGDSGDLNTQAGLYINNQFGTLAIAAGVEGGVFPYTQNAITIITPAVDAGTATNGQVLTLTNATSGKVEFVTSPTSNSITADNGIYSNTLNNVQLGGPTYADADFDSDRYIDTTSNSFYLKGQPVTTLGPGGTISGVLNITNDLASGIATGLKIDVDQPGQTTGYGLYVNTGKAAGVSISSAATCLDITSSGTGLSKAVKISSINTTAIEAGSQSNSNTDPVISAGKYGTVDDDIQVVLSLIKSSNAGVGQPGIGAAIQFSLGTNTPQNVDRAGNIVCAATDTTTNAISTYYMFSLRDAGVEQQVLVINAKGIFELPLGLDDYTNDTTAAAGGIPLNGLYRTGSNVKIRVS